MGDRLITGLGGGINGSLERLNRALGERLRAQLGKKAAQPEEDLDHYVHNLPEVIPESVSHAFTGICGGPLREGRVMTRGPCNAHPPRVTQEVSRSTT